MRNPVARNPAVKLSVATLSGASSRVGRWFSVWLAALALWGCGGHLASQRPLGADVQGPSRVGWGDLAAGNDDQAMENFRRQLAAKPHDVLANLGAFAIHDGRADAGRALAHAIDILESVARRETPPGDAVAATAVTARVQDLLDEAGDAQILKRLLTLVGRPALPWQTRVVLAGVADEWSRRAGNQQQLDEVAKHGGCLQNVRVAGPLGRLAVGDLTKARSELSPRGLLPGVAEAQFPAGAGGTVATPSGCRIAVTSATAASGVLILDADIQPSSDAAPGGRWAIAMDYLGLAAVRVDGGPWHHHGSAEEYAATWSALPVDLDGGTHHVEVRLASYGGAAFLSLALLPDPTSSAGMHADENDPDPRDDAMGAARAYAAGLAALAIGDGRGMMAATHDLRRQHRFAVGAALAGRLAHADPSRPDHMARDRARAEFRRAVGLDESLSRAWLALARLEHAEGRSRDAGKLAARAVKQAPNYWPGFQALYDIHEADDLERDADRALDRALALRDATADPQAAHMGCQLLESAALRARRRQQVEQERAFGSRANECDVRSTTLADYLQSRGQMRDAATVLQRAVAYSFPVDWLAGQHGAMLLAGGQLDRAVEVLKKAVARAPRDPGLRVKLADAYLAQGNSAAARALLHEGKVLHPGSLEVQDAARLLGVPLSVADHRVSGTEIVRAFEAAQRRYEAPAVVVLDRLVERIEPDGSIVNLTHMIVRVQSKDAIDRWGEVAIPAGGQVLTLRTIKADGRLLEPEEIFGKETVSAPELGPGDYVEWETLQSNPPVDAFAPGFVGSRFFFQSFEAPLDRSEYVVITPPGLDAASLQIDRRAGAPVAKSTSLADGWQETTFAVRQVAQVFPEAAGVPARDWVPSVRLSYGIEVGAWSQYLDDRFLLMSRSNPELKRLAGKLAQDAGNDAANRVSAIVSWVGKNIEAEGGLEDPATFTLARGRGNRVALMTALSRELGLDVHLTLARSVFSVAADEPVIIQDLEDFAQPVLAFPGLGPAGKPLYVDPSLKHAPPGYLAPGLDGARVLPVGRKNIDLAHSTQGDGRTVKLQATVNATGGARITVNEDLRGLPALQWADAMERVGDDREKLLREFEESWLSQQFPGATLEELDVSTDPPGQGRAHVQYAFTLSHFGLVRDDGLVLIPEFFQARPGQRFASKPGRTTPLLLGYEVPLDLQAVLTLPEGAEVVDAGQSNAVTIANLPGLEFREKRSVLPGPTVTIHRIAALPIARVAPSDYRRVSEQLRKVDPQQSSPIRIRLSR